MILLSFVFLPIILGLIGYLPWNRWSRVISFSVQGILGLVLLYIGLKLPLPINVNLLHTPTPVGMSLRLDQLSYFLLVLTNALFLMLHIFAMSSRYYEKKFIFLFLSLQGLINGIFLSTDFFNIYLILEVATVVASVLIMYKKDSKSINDGMIYLMSNMIGMTFFLMGLGYLYKMFGVLSFDAIRASAAQYSVSQMALPLAFLLTGASLKSAILPVSSWLPKAHGTASAPIVVSAVLSGIFVKTGVYVFIRIQSILLPGNELGPIFLFIGIITAFAGVILALVQIDVKLIWAYSTVSQMGWIMTGLNSGNLAGIEGAHFHILAHALYKSTLFLCASQLITIYGTRNINKMRGLMTRAWPVAVPLLISLLSMTGAPFTLGYISKNMLKNGIYNSVPSYVVWGLSILSASYLIRFIPVLFGEVNSYMQVCDFKLRWNQILPLWLMTAFSVGLSILNLESQSLEKLGMSLIDYSIILALAGGLNFVLNRIGQDTFHRIRKVDLSFNSLAFMILAVFMFLLNYTSRLG